MIGPSTAVQIRGKDPGGNWYQIVFPQAKNGLGWVTSLYVTVQNKDSIPVLAAAAGEGPSGVVMQQVNVRSLPGMDSNSVGTLNARDVVSLTGRDPGGLWLQIEYAAAPGGKGWVAAGYVQASGLDQLPIVGQAGQIVGTATATGVPPTPIPTPGIAAPDNDLAQVPAVDITLSPTGIGSFIYAGGLSAPAGDSQDWIRFTPYGTRLSARLDCQGDAIPHLELTVNGMPVTSQDLPNCGMIRFLELSSRQPYLLRLFVSSAQGQQEYIRYTLTIDSLP